MRIYVASSWRNKIQQNIIKVLRDHGYTIYDFRNPDPCDTGFHWSEIDPNWKMWNKYLYRTCLNHPIAQNGFEKDFIAMKWADIFIGVQPFGRSASIEMGWAAGKGKKTIMLLADGEPELMIKIFDYICCDLDEVLKILNDL